MKIKTAFILARVACVAFAPVSALAGSQEDQQACMNALTACSQLIPDRNRGRLSYFQPQPNLESLPGRRPEPL
jgi:hypothetical protein